MTAKPARRLRDRIGRFATVLGPESRFTGEFGGGDDYIVLGSVEGDCRIEGTVLLERGGRWTGRVQARRIILAGELNGEAVADEQIEVVSSAQIRGHLYAPAIAIDAGAVLDGQLHASAQDAPVVFRERRSRNSA